MEYTSRVARILVVDDERDVVTLVGFLLKKDGHEVDAAYNGGEALERLGLEPKGEPALPNMVIMDVMMPVADGYTVARRAGEDLRTKGVPILMLTAKGQTRELFEGQANVAAVLEKPFDPQRLREMVKSILLP
ncbi:MAG: Response regulators consisting of a CheY-like receiver domain and a winged-helix DNA-binding domain [Elusimicrobia bacterium]|nr:MAG: Response regulators consisting of a CheY-like receiver domain and a winged-helix DNA-binding domain [Elusimicrobiota bacterium]